MSSFQNYKRKYKTEIKNIKQQQSEAIRLLKEAEKKEKELKQKSSNMTPFECEVDDILQTIQNSTKTTILGIVQQIGDDDPYPITKKQLNDIIKSLRKSHFMTMNGGFEETSESSMIEHDEVTDLSSDDDYKTIKKKKKVEMKCECSPNYRCKGTRCSCQKIDKRCTDKCGCYGVYDAEGNPICKNT
jgi:hypothetical protein